MDKRSPGWRGRTTATAGRVAPQICAFGIVGILLSIPQVRVHRPVALLAERFFPGAGWFEIIVLATYAAWLVGVLLTTASSALVRQRVWIFFSVVFFAQALVGISGFETFLMSGNPHLPIPALIVAGPLYRGEGFFMPILLGATMVCAGPIWCSWLCYCGAWDHLAAGKRVVRASIGKPRKSVQAVLAVAIIAIALLMQALETPPGIAAMAAVVYGAGGIVVILFVSRIRGTMVHCTAYCPIGMIATTLGRINPFRIRISRACTQCRACTAVCRYDALSDRTIARHKPGVTCTLCGDCVSACPHGALSYHFPGFSATVARRVFLTAAVILHTVFLGFGRL